MKPCTFLFCICLFLSLTNPVTAHEPASATYLGNEAVMIKDGDTKVLFDPFFHKDYGRFQLVPESIHHKIMKGVPPYDGVDALFISHAHGDHFDVADVIQYLTAHPGVVLIAPQQAIEQMLSQGMEPALLQRIRGQSMQPGDEPKKIEFGNIAVDVMRIPHAGWPAWQDVDNFIYRVTVNEHVSVMHLGDADDKRIHFEPYQEYFQKHPTSMGFPPFWFFMSEDGLHISDKMLNTGKNIGIHVPRYVPEALKASGKDYFFEPGKSIPIHENTKANGTDL